MTSARIAPGRLTGCRVLVVDDHVDAADSLGLMLELLGAEVSVAYDGRSAVEAARTLSPRVVLLDIGMPGMDGYETARLIREQAGDQPIQFMALTGWGQQEDIDRSVAAGFDMHLVKPVSLDALTAALDRCTNDATSVT
ncbi:MAG: response regulator [Vicinamibacterales bacterium]